MKKLDLTRYGITGTKEIVYNPSYELLFKDEMDPTLTGYEKGQLSELDAVNVRPPSYSTRYSWSMSFSMSSQPVRTRSRVRF